MATVPVTRTWVAGEVVTAGYMNNNLTAVLNWLLAPAICQVRSTTVQSLPNNAFTALNFPLEDVDSTGMHSTSVNTSRLTAVYPGWYSNSGAVSYASHATGRRGGQWTVNASNVASGSTLVASGIAANLAVPVRTIATFLNVGDYLELRGYQDSGAALNTLGSTAEGQNVTSLWVSN